MRTRNLIEKRIVILGITLLIVSNVLTATFVRKNIKEEILEDQFILAMNAANDYFESFEQYGSNLDKKLAISEWGAATRVAYQFDPNSRIYKERGSLNLFYYELQKDNDAIPICYTKGLCQKLAENPYDMTAYAELTELINLISHKN